MSTFIRCGRAGAFCALAAAACLLGGGRAACAQAVNVEAFKAQVFDLLNQKRAAYGQPPLQRAASLDAAAQSYSQVMVKATAGGTIYLSHTGPDGSTILGRISKAGYDGLAYGENIAVGQKTPLEVVDAWMNSAGHRANILNPAFRDAGLGLSIGPGSWPNGFRGSALLFWTTDFGAPNTSSAGASAVPLSVPAPPMIIGYTAASGVPIGSAAPGAQIRVMGFNLGDSGTVRFNNTTAPAPTTWSPTSITVTVPAAPSYPSRGPVIAVVNGQTATGPEFTIMPAAAAASPVTTPRVAPAPAPAPAPTPAAVMPRISGVTDLAGTRVSTVRAGALIVLRGSGFGPSLSGGSAVLFSTTAGVTRSAAIYRWQDDAITVAVPSMSGLIWLRAQVSIGGKTQITNQVALTVGATARR